MATTTPCPDALRFWCIQSSAWLADWPADLADSILSRHIHTSLVARHRILTPPQARDSFRLRIKIKAGLAVKRTRATARDASLVPREAEHGQGDGDGDIDPDLAGLDVPLETGRCASAPGENRDAVAVVVCVDEVDCVVDGGDI